MRDIEDHISRSREERKAEPVSILSGHGRVLLAVSQTAGETLEQIGLRLGLSGQQVKLSVKVLERSGILLVERVGRQNAYEVDKEAQLSIHGIGSLRIGGLISSVIKENQYE